MYRALTGRSVFYLWYPLEPLLCLPPTVIGGFFVNPDTGIQDDSLGGCTRDLLYLPAESQKRGGNYSNNGRHSKHCRVCTKGQRPTLCPNSQVLDKPWLDFSQDVVPSRRFGPRNWERPRHLTVGCGRVFSGMLQAFTGASKTWSTERDSAGVGCIWVRGPWWNWR